MWQDFEEKLYSETSEQRTHWGQDPCPLFRGCPYLGGWLAGHTSDLELVNRFNTEGCGLQEAESASLDQTCSAGQKSTKKHRSGQAIWVTMSKGWCYSYDLCSQFWPLFAFGGYFVQIAVRWGWAGCLLSGVERCPLLGGSKCTISMGRVIRGMEFVRCTEMSASRRVRYKRFHCTPTTHNYQVLDICII